MSHDILINLVLLSPGRGFNRYVRTLFGGVLEELAFRLTEEIVKYFACQSVRMKCALDTHVPTDGEHFRLRSESNKSANAKFKDRFKSWTNCEKYGKTLSRYVDHRIGRNSET